MRQNIKKIVLLAVFVLLFCCNSFGQGLHGIKGNGTSMLPSKAISASFPAEGESISYVKSFPAFKDLNLISIYNSKQEPINKVAKLYYRLNNGKEHLLKCDSYNQQFRLMMKKGVDTLYLKVVVRGYETEHEKF